jgi:hypothetical protein
MFISVFARLEPYSPFGFIFTMPLCEQIEVIYVAGNKRRRTIFANSLPMKIR